MQGAPAVQDLRAVAGSLIGRDDEIAVLERVAARVARHEPSVLVIEGEAGIGKTSLVRLLAADQSRRGAKVLVGACSPGAGRDLPLDLWRGVLRGLGQSADRSAVGDGWSASRGQVLASITEQLLTVARRSSTTVVLEDVHWADESSLDLLDYLVRSARDERLLIVVTVRSADPAYALVRDQLVQLSGLPQVTVVRPRRLSQQEVARQLETLTGETPDRGVVEETTERSAGVPFLVEEMVAAGVTTGTAGPGFARDLLGHRIRALSVRGRLLVEVAALGRDPLDEDLLFHVAGLPDEALDAAVAEAVSAGVLEQADDGGYRFRHALLREAAAHGLAPRRRQQLHRRWAEAIAAAHPSGPGALAAEQAEHWSAAGDDTRALVASVQAAAEARRVFAHRERLRLLLGVADAWESVPDAEALTGTDLGWVLADAAELAQMFSEVSTARDLVSRGRRLLGRPEDRPRRAWFDLVELWIRWDVDEPVPVADVEAVVAAIRPQGLGRQLTRALFTLSNSLLQDGKPEAARPVAREARAMASGLSDPVLELDAAGHLALVLAVAGEFEEALRFSDEELTRADALGDLVVREEALTTRGVVLWESGDLRGATAAAERGRVLLGADRPGPMPAAWALHTLNSVEGLLDLGRWEEARERLDTVAAAKEQLTPLMLSWAHRLGGWLAVVRGDLTRERFVLGQMPDREHQRIQDAFAATTSVVDMLTHLGLHDRARSEANTVLCLPRTQTGIPAFVWPLLAVVTRNEVEAPIGAADPAVLERVAELAAVVPAPNALLGAHAKQVAADLAWANGAPDLGLCRAAEQSWGLAGMPYWQAWALLRTGHLAARQGDKIEGRAALVHADGLAAALRAGPLQDRIRSTAREVSVRLSARTGTRNPDPTGLTPREHEVLHLLGQGASNRQIADRLVISEKTVSVHVSNVLTKLQVSSRGRAVAAATRLGLLDRRE